LTIGLNKRLIGVVVVVVVVGTEQLVVA